MKNVNYKDNETQSTQTTKFKTRMSPMMAFFLTASSAVLVPIVILTYINLKKPNSTFTNNSNYYTNYYTQYEHSTRADLIEPMKAYLKDNGWSKKDIKNLTYSQLLYYTIATLEPTSEKQILLYVIEDYVLPSVPFPLDLINYNTTKTYPVTHTYPFVDSSLKVLNPKSEEFGLTTCEIEDYVVLAEIVPVLPDNVENLIRERLEIPKREIISTKPEEVNSDISEEQSVETLPTPEEQLVETSKPVE